jgi:hypothetical protein
MESLEDGLRPRGYFVWGRGVSNAILDAMLGVD